MPAATSNANATLNLSLPDDYAARLSAYCAPMPSARQQRKKPTKRAIEHAVKTLLAAFDADPSRDGLRETPARVARMYAELTSAPAFTFTTFDAEGADQLVIVRDIPFYSLCEHHLLPFFGTASVAYIPNGRIVGLSKLARAVEHVARRLQTQERITNAVADMLVDALAPRGVGVVLHARHLCMEMRGVEKPGATTTTSALRGALLDEPDARAEFMLLAHTR